VPGRSLPDTHVVSPLARGLYYPDGQMRDEVYNYGSYKQSKMFAAGVTCSDCHEPHAAKLRASDDGVCLQCHAADKYAAITHHHHEAVNRPLSCASCHMPERTYMVVDRRHDHSFRVPRPDLSAKLGTPNACNDCHADKSAQWAVSAIETWYGTNRKGWQRYAEAFHSAWTDQADAAALLGAVAGDANTPAFARASALTELAPYLSPANINLARSALADPDPMVRIGALDMLANVSPSQIWPLVAPLLTDSNRGVRIRAAALLATVPTASQPAGDREPCRPQNLAARRLYGRRATDADRPRHLAFGRRVGDEQLAGHRQLLRQRQGGAVDALRRPRRRNLFRHGQAGACAADRADETTVSFSISAASLQKSKRTRNWLPSTARCPVRVSITMR
jgi:predicted CXXCH cytochrome family protein